MNVIRFTLAVGLFVVGSLDSRTHGVEPAEWARKLFAATEYKFGAVPRGSRAEHLFNFVNTQDAELHIAEVRSSCGCTKARLASSDTIQPGETGSVSAKFNTDAFIGAGSATVTVVFDKPTYAEVQLSVAGYVMRDVLVDPGEVDFGESLPGSSAERRVEVRNDLNPNWRIVKVRNSLPHVRVQVGEPQRNGLAVKYTLTVKLDGEAKAAELIDQIVLETEGGETRLVIVPVAGRVAETLSVSPQPLAFGKVVAGKPVTKNLVVRSREPFRILSLGCTDSRFRFSFEETPRALQIVGVTFLAEKSSDASVPESVQQMVQIKTDLADAAVGNALFTASVVAPD